VAQQRPTLSNAVRAYVSVDAPLIALTHVRVIDGTGAAPREDQTLILNNGVITTMGSSAGTDVPAGAQTIDLTGKSVIPGLVMVHEHLYYPNGPGVYGQLGESFSRLYLSGGVTTMRTGGNVNGFMDLNMMRLVDAGQKPGPAIDATAPYLNGPNTFIQMRTLKGPEDARRQVQYWTDEGATSLKTYMQITRGELAAAINEAHRRGIKVTGHLCSVTYAEAANLGKQIAELETPNKGNRAGRLVFSPDGGLLVGPHTDETWVWDVRRLPPSPSSRPRSTGCSRWNSSVPWRSRASNCARSWRRAGWNVWRVRCTPWPGHPTGSSGGSTPSRSGCAASATGSAAYASSSSDQPTRHFARRSVRVMTLFVSSPPYDHPPTPRRSASAYPAPIAWSTAAITSS